MHVAQLSFFIDPERRKPELLLRAWPSLVDVAEAATLGGARVAVIQAASYDERIEQNGVEYIFLAPDAGAATIAGSRRFRDLLRERRVDVFHVHGLGFASDVVALAALEPHTPILMQDHASRVPRIWRRALWRRGLSCADGVAFCAVEQAQPFIDAGLLHSRTKVFAIPESTSRFRPGDQDEARRLTEIYGHPAVLWVGHLDSNKDPLTVLRGVSLAARHLNDLHLWCCFASAPLMKEVQRAIEADTILWHRVHLLGRVPHERIEHLMRAADVFVLGSHREGSGYSLIEALACGLPPVVTDIPSFRALTGDHASALWKRGDPAALASALLRCAPTLGTNRANVRAHFDQEVSFAAVGRKLLAAYAGLVESRIVSLGASGSAS